MKRNRENYNISSQSKLVSFSRRKTDRHRERGRGGERERGRERGKTGEETEEERR